MSLMRIEWFAALAAGWGLVVAGAVPALAQEQLDVAESTPIVEIAADDQLSRREIDRWLRIAQKPDKPSEVSTGAYSGNDSCQYANDGECDDLGLGTGACPVRTDYSDCWRLAEGVEDDSCQWANDNECDEPLGLGTGACPQATDFSDCQNVIHLRGQDDSCATALNGVCEEPGLGNGSCAANTDRGDCIGRDRPMEINDHYFGRDDRVIMDTAVFPWSVIGVITLEGGGTCTATLIANDVLITASHCINGDRGTNSAGTFATGFGRPDGMRTARIIDHMIDPNWDNERFSNSDDFDGTDWAMLRIDQPLGAELGHVGVRALVDTAGARGARRASLYQAGYSRDTGDHLSGNIGCEILDVMNDNTMQHNCDTTQGDSGSPFMVEENGQYYVVATDSNYRRVPNAPVINIAARSDGWTGYYDDFVAGRLGASNTRPQGPGKPDKN
jgi:protease YdgD